MGQSLISLMMKFKNEEIFSLKLHELNQMLNKRVHLLCFHYQPDGSKIEAKFDWDSKKLEIII